MGFYPRLVIDKDKMMHNLNVIINLCRENDISLTGVVKGFNGIKELVWLYDGSDVAHIGDSRLQRLCEYKKMGVKKSLLLLRLPMRSEIPDLVNCCDISLNSDYKTMELINEQCRIFGKTHGVVLMLDMGDLREGIFDVEAAIKTAAEIEKNLKHLKLLGVGTNLGCYGAVRPTEINIGKLVQIARDIESVINRKLEIISAGATTSVTLLLDKKMPKGATNLRVGEEIILAYDLPALWGYDDMGMHMDIFKLEAQIIEVANKPSMPVGEMFVDAFGNYPEFEDKGIRKKALIAVGKLDIGSPDHLIPNLPGITLLGGSSDHTIMDITDCPEQLEVGSIVSFNLKYGSLMYASASQTVYKSIV